MEILEKMAGMIYRTFPNSSFAARPAPLYTLCQKILAKALTTNFTSINYGPIKLGHVLGAQRIESVSVNIYFSSTLAFGFGPLLLTRRASGLLI